MLLVPLAACVSYRPAPLDARAIGRQWQARRLDDPALAARLRGILPARDAGQWPPPAWGRAELLAAALVLNPGLAEARARLAAASAAVITARAYPNPTVGLTLERYTQAQQAGHPWLWGVSTDWLLDTALRRRLRRALADADVRAARLAYAEQVWAVRAALRDALNESLLAAREQRLASRAAKLAGAMEAAARQRLALGEDSPVAVLQASQALARARAGAAGARQRLVASRARLAQAVGVPPAALDGLPLRWDDLDRPAMPGRPMLERLSDRALLSRADLERALVAYQKSETELHQQVRAQYPQITLGPGYTYDHGIRKLTFGMSASLPLFNRNEGPIAQARAHREEAAAHVRRVQADIAGGIASARARLASALPALAAAGAGERAAAEQQRRVEHGFALGAVDRPAVLAARLATIEAQRTRLAILAQAWQAHAALEDALRAPLDAAEAAMAPDPSGDRS